MEQLTAEIKERVEALQETRERRLPVGVNGWVLAWLIACLGGEWALRKRWNLSRSSMPRSIMPIRCRIERDSSSRVIASRPRPLSDFQIVQARWLRS